MMASVVLAGLIYFICEMYLYDDTYNLWITYAELRDTEILRAYLRANNLRRLIPKHVFLNNITHTYDYNFYDYAVLVSKNLTLYTMFTCSIQHIESVYPIKAYITFKITYNFISEGECGTARTVPSTYGGFLSSPV